MPGPAEPALRTASTSTPSVTTRMRARGRPMRSRTGTIPPATQTARSALSSARRVTPCRRSSTQCWRATSGRDWTVTASGRRASRAASAASSSPYPTSRPRHDHVGPKGEAGKAEHPTTCVRRGVVGDDVACLITSPSGTTAPSGGPWRTVNRTTSAPARRQRSARSEETRIAPLSSRSGSTSRIRNPRRLCRPTGVPVRRPPARSPRFQPSSKEYWPRPTLLRSRGSRRTARARSCRRV